MQPCDSLMVVKENPNKKKTTKKNKTKTKQLFTNFVRYFEAFQKSFQVSYTLPSKNSQHGSITPYTPQVKF